MSLVNNHPVGVQGLMEYNIQPLTPNMLLLGRTSTTPLPEVDYSERYDKFSKRLAYMEQLEKEWWNLWFIQVFDNLLPHSRRSSSRVRENMQVGNICLLQYKNKMSKGDYRLCRITETFPDGKGVVRKVEIEMRPRDKRDASLPYKSKTLVRQIVTIQRLVFLDEGQV